MNPVFYNHRLFRFLLLIALVASFSNAKSQQAKAGLERLMDESINCYYSPGNEERAEKIAKFCSDAMAYYNEVLKFSPGVDLFVLSKTDWSNHTDFPVYGMPHYFDGKLVVASEDNEFWKSFIPAKGSLPADLEIKMSRAYTNETGSVSMQLFFDLLVLHELGHAYYMQAGITAQRFWLSEFFSNIFLHTYVAEKHPEMLPSLTVFPEIVIATGSGNYKYNTLLQLEDNYELIGKEHPQNYGWYQSRWHKGAGQVYDAAGKDLVLKFWNGFREQRGKVGEDDLAQFLREKVHPAMANFYTEWNKK